MNQSLWDRLGPTGRTRSHGDDQGCGIIQGPIKGIRALQDEPGSRKMNQGSTRRIRVLQDESGLHKTN